MTFQRKQLGATGEELAAQFLIQKGYRILARNLKIRYGEVDIVALDSQTTVIVEVKTKTSLVFGDPIDMITPRKQQKLRQLATALAIQHQLVEYRIDVVTIDLSNRQSPIIKHYQAVC